MKALKRLVVLSLLFTALLGTQAQAQGLSDYQLRHRSPAKPVFSVSVSFMSGIPDLIGAEFTLKALDPLRIEGGVAFLLLAQTEYLRAGYTIPLMNQRDPRFHDGWTLNFIPMLGVRRVHGGWSGHTESFGASAVGVLELTYWFARHFGIEAKLNGGVGYLFQPSKNEAAVIPEIKLSLGLAF